MKIHFENNVLSVALQDLHRPHSHAFERIGYFIGDVIEELFVANEWLSFEDDLYEETDEVGARIGKAGMKKLMSAALTKNRSFLQFHLHDFERIPHFSSTDLSSLKEIMPSLFNFSSANFHGGLILGSTHFRSIVWKRNQIEPKETHFEFKLMEYKT